MPKADRYQPGDRYTFARADANEAFGRSVAPGNVFDIDGYTVQVKNFDGPTVDVEVLQDTVTTEQTFRLRRLTQLARLSFMESSGVDPTKPLPDDKKPAMAEFLRAHVPEDPELVTKMLAEIKGSALNALNYRLDSLNAGVYVKPSERPDEFPEMPKSSIIAREPVSGEDAPRRPTEPPASGSFLTIAGLRIEMRQAIAFAGAVLLLFGVFAPAVSGMELGYRSQSQHHVFRSLLGAGGYTGVIVLICAVASLVLAFVGRLGWLAGPGMASMFMIVISFFTLSKKVSLEPQLTWGMAVLTLGAVMVMSSAFWGLIRRAR